MRKTIFFLLLVVLSGCSQQKAQQLVADQLIDPSSAQFRNVRTVSPSYGGKRVCGEVNGKNRMGAYAGFSRFIVTVDTDRVEMDQPNARPSEVTSRQLAECRRPSYSGYVRDCSFDEERYAESMLAEMFENEWQRVCEGGSPGSALDRARNNIQESRGEGSDKVK
jgi:hypothetical protein